MRGLVVRAHMLSTIGFEYVVVGCVVSLYITSSREQRWAGHAARSRAHSPDPAARTRHTQPGPRAPRARRAGRCELSNLSLGGCERTVSDLALDAPGLASAVAPLVDAVLVAQLVLLADGAGSAEVRHGGVEVVGGVGGVGGRRDLANSGRLWLVRTLCMPSRALLVLKDIRVTCQPDPSGVTNHHA